MTDLLAMLDDMDRDNPERIDRIVARPFKYIGSKRRQAKHILPHLPYTSTYVEVFGGSGSILLARDEVKLEVYNDLFEGVVSVYKCLRDPALLKQLCERAECCLSSRHEFVDCKNQWDKQSDLVQKAFMWLYMTHYSYSAKGKVYGRAIRPNAKLANLANKIPDWDEIHRRIRDVQIEQLDYRQCMLDFDTPDTVFYLDPPYVEGDQYIYDHSMDHVAMLDLVHNQIKGFVAISGYHNSEYARYKWDHVVEWYTNTTMSGESTDAANNKEKNGRVASIECLYIKEAQK